MKRNLILAESGHGMDMFKVDKCSTKECKGACCEYLGLVPPLDLRYLNYIEYSEENGTFRCKQHDRESDLCRVYEERPPSCIMFDCNGSPPLPSQEKEEMNKRKMFLKELGLDDIGECSIHVYDGGSTRRAWSAEEEEILAECIHKTLEEGRSKPKYGTTIKIATDLGRSQGSVSMKLGRMKKELLRET